MSQSSKIKDVSYSLLGIIDALVRPEIKNAWALKLWDWFALKRAKAIIESKPDLELQTKMKESYDLMKPIFEKVNVANEIKDSRELNDPNSKMQKFVEKSYSDALELIP